MILAVETSDILCSVAFWSDGRRLAEYNHELPMQHATLVGELVEQGLAFLADSVRRQTYSIKDLKAVAVAIGPGSFTGLRIGLGYVQGFCLGRNLPVVGISNHQVLAYQRVSPERPVYTVIEARRNEIYFAENELHEDGYPELKSHRIIIKDDLKNNLEPGSQIVFKRELELLPSIEKELRDKDILIHRSGIFSAGMLAELASLKIELSGYDSLENLEPMYIRPFAGMQ